MPDGTSERSDSQLPHLIVPWAAADHAFKGRSAPQQSKIRQITDRSGHASRLADQLAAAEEESHELQADTPEELRADGFALAVDGWSDQPGYALALQSLDANGAKLLSVHPGSQTAGERAVLWLPYRAVGRFFARIEQFATEQTRTGKPKNLNLVANIAELRLALLHDLWQEPDEFPAPDRPQWWEIWLARLRGEPDPANVLREVAAQREWATAGDTLALPDNVIALVRATAGDLGLLLGTSAIPSELHKARVTSEILGLDHLFQRDLITDLQTRIEPAAPEATAVCVLDTGVMSGHPLLRASVDSTHSALAGIGPAGQAGHGTQMAGLALFEDLDAHLHDTGKVVLRHRLESVTVIRGNHDTETDPDMYGTISATATAQVELAQPRRRRAFSMAVTADDPGGSDGRPTSWSAALDALAFGTDIRRSDTGIELLGQPDPQAARLYLVSAGNISAPYEADYLALCDASKVQSPAQAWNVLSVGAYTEKAELPSDPAFRGWKAVAPAGELSPFSRTSMLFRRSWPVKPDIVLEGGNLLSDGQIFDCHDGVSLLTTSNRPHALLTTANATSAATAQAARLAAVAMETYPTLWPETTRALLVHSSEWTPSMRAHFDAAGSAKTKRLQLIRRYGWGVPTEERLLTSASNSVTLMVQDQFLPFERGKSGIAMRAFRLHRLPWPQEQLRELFAARVRLRVTLSYFVEPNPSSRGWQGRYRYASHGLRFDVKRPTESLEDFQRRVSNEAAQEETASAPSGSDSDTRWYLGGRTRNVGSLHADTWMGTGAELADSGFIGVTPVGGWWKENNRRDRIDLPVRYALLVSLHTDAVGTDIYTPIATQIGIPVEIAT